jgi:hypothetical protein
MHLPSHTLTAYNDAAASANKIHDDTVAQQYGFRGGLVPGVSVYAYMTYPLVQSFGVDWLTQGTARVQFSKPIYEGDAVTVTGTVTVVDDTIMGFDIAGLNAAGVACGIGTATLPCTISAAPALDDVPLGPRQVPRVPASWDAIVVGEPLPVLTLTVTPEENEAYCQAHTDDLDIYRGAQGYVHPGMLLRQCNRIFSEHFILGPWIHVGSDIATYRPCRVREALEIRGVPVQKFEKKGHEFAVLDVLIVADGAAAQRVTHTCIFRPRQHAAAV